MRNSTRMTGAHRITEVSLAMGFLGLFDSFMQPPDALITNVSMRRVRQGTLMQVNIESILVYSGI